MDPAPTDLAVAETQFDIALQRLTDEARTVDPQSACARFSSAF
jgi:hypothetical protein